jgi:thiopurine S-methyltransferase
MDAHFWHQRWEMNEIGFHESQANPLLVKHITALNLSKQQRVFLPLCGKTLDIAWLLSQGYRVCGIELSELAVKQLFIELGVEAQVSRVNDLLCYQADGLDIFVGDIFKLRAEDLGQVDAVYDRAALVALPHAMRQDYTAHLIGISQRAQQLLISFEYDQSLMPGPPFAISAAEIQQHYASHYQITLLERLAVEGGLKGECEAFEAIHLLYPT